MDKIIWQPHFGSRYDFSVDLNRTFAKEMIEARIPLERQLKMNELANEDLKRLDRYWLNPYTFHKDSGFVSQFYIGNNGVWLSTDNDEINSLVRNETLGKPIEYHSHNIDTPKEAYILMVLFDTWAKYAEILKNV